MVSKFCWKRKIKWYIIQIITVWSPAAVTHSSRGSSYAAPKRKDTWNSHIHNFCDSLTKQWLFVDLASHIVRPTCVINKVWTTIYNERKPICLNWIMLNQCGKLKYKSGLQSCLSLLNPDICPILHTIPHEFAHSVLCIFWIGKLARLQLSNLQ